jgi:hypothetical protein
MVQPCFPQSLPCKGFIAFAFLVRGGRSLEPIFCEGAKHLSQKMGSEFTPQGNRQVQVSGR